MASLTGISARPLSQTGLQRVTRMLASPDHAVAAKGVDLVGREAKQRCEHLVGILTQPRGGLTHRARRRAHTPWYTGMGALAHFRMLQFDQETPFSQMTVERQVLVGQRRHRGHARPLEELGRLPAIPL